MYFGYNITATENVVLEEGALGALMSASGGDMRKAVTFLQSSHQLSGGASVSMKMVTDIGGQVCDENAHINHYNDGVLYDYYILNCCCYCVVILMIMSRYLPMSWIQFGRQCVDDLLMHYDWLSMMQ